MKYQIINSTGILYIINVFKIGDRIHLKKEKRSGAIEKIISPNKFIINTSDGFSITVSSKDIVLVDSSTNTSEAYGRFFLKKDSLKDNKIIKKKKRSLYPEIDLHFSNIDKDYKKLNNYDIIQKQILICKEELSKAIKSNENRIVIIHGIGTGILRQEVHKILDEYKLRYFLSLDGGSTEVIL